MSDQTPPSRRAPSRIPSARALRKRPGVEVDPPVGFPWFEVFAPTVIDGEVLAGPGSDHRIPPQRREPGD